jgi:hypothetical protein
MCVGTAEKKKHGRKEIMIWDYTLILGKIRCWVAH